MCWWRSDKQSPCTETTETGDCQCIFYKTTHMCIFLLIWRPNQRGKNTTEAFLFVSSGEEKIVVISLNMVKLGLRRVGKRWWLWLKETILPLLYVGYFMFEQTTNSAIFLRRTGFPSTAIVVLIVELKIIIIIWRKSPHNQRASSKKKYKLLYNHPAEQHLCEKMDLQVISFCRSWISVTFSECWLTWLIFFLMYFRGEFYIKSPLRADK